MIHALNWMCDISFSTSCFFVINLLILFYFYWIDSSSTRGHSWYPWLQVTPFPLFEFQSKWIAGAVSGRIALPSEKAMMEETENFYAELEAAGVPKRHTHMQPKTQVTCKFLKIYCNSHVSFHPAFEVEFELAVK